MAHDLDEARSWLERPIDAEELGALLEAIKAALEAHDGPLCSGELTSLVAAEQPADGASIVDAAINDNFQHG